MDCRKKLSGCRTCSLPALRDAIIRITKKNKQKKPNISVQFLVGVVVPIAIGRTCGLPALRDAITRITKKINKKSRTSLFSFWSGWQDSNLRPPAPKAGAITELRYTPKSSANVQLFFTYTNYFHNMK